MTLRLTWTRTWDDQSYHIEAFDGDIPVGRVFRILGGPADKDWQWSMLAQVGNQHGTAGGVADDRDTACRLVEDAYRALRQRIKRG